MCAVYIPLNKCIITFYPSQTIVEEPAKPVDPAPSEKEKDVRPPSVSKARAETPVVPHPETLRPPSVPAGE